MSGHSKWANIKNKKAKNAYFGEYEFASMIYCATLFRTFKENYVASTYSPKTQTNSDRQLCSDAGWLSYIYKILFGIDFVDNGIKISPFVFDSLKNGISLKNFTWNGNKMNISIQGTGDKVVSYTVNGKSVPSDYVIPYENNKVYDINSVLEEARKNRKEKDELEEKRKLKNTSYNILADLNGLYLLFFISRGSINKDNIICSIETINIITAVN